MTWKCPTWYDNFNEKSDELPEGIEVDRIYCLDWAEFKPEDHLRLDRFFQSLPGYLQEPIASSGPYWFGRDEEKPPFLWAQKEPPGLQVYGIIGKDVFRSWHDVFLDLIQTFPLRTE